MDRTGDLGADAFGLGGVAGLRGFGEDGEALGAVAGLDADCDGVAGPDAWDGAGGAFDVGRVDVLAGDDDHILGAAADVELAVFVEIAEVTGAQPAVWGGPVEPAVLG